eukprot:6181131-Pleurochrysis_carterae.AAC.4
MGVGECASGGGRGRGPRASLGGEQGRRRLGLSHAVQQRLFEPVVATWPHGGLAAEPRHVAARVALRLGHEPLQLARRQRVCHRHQPLGEHVGARLCVGQRDEQPLLQPPPRRVVELLRPVRRAHHKQTRAAAAAGHAVHLHQDLVLHADRALLRKAQRARGYTKQRTHSRTHARTRKLPHARTRVH